MATVFQPNPKTLLSPDGVIPDELANEQIEPYEPIGGIADRDDTVILREAAMLRLAELANAEGDLSALLTEAQLTEIGGRVITDYDTDLAERSDWERIAKRALEKASQEGERTEKTYPWHRASNVNYPLLTVAGLQFNARAYPAIVKGDEAASAKVVGADKGLPLLGEDGRPVMQLDGMRVLVHPQLGLMVLTPQGPQPLPEGAQPQPVWTREPGAKAKRAQRVKDYLNHQLFYRMDDWEADTDLLLMQLPIVGCAFRKVYYSARERKHCSKLVSALNLVVPCGAKDCKTAARLSEVLPEQYPFEMLELIRAGYYRQVDFLEGEDFTETARCVIEQHTRFDLDGDGYPEPYVVTVDQQSSEVLRIVANFEMADIDAKDGVVVSVKARQYYVKYGFFPHPEGKFYDIGLGHLLDQIGGIIDTIINQMIDAGTAQVAGGGFIGSGVRLQESKRSTTLRMAPGEYKTVNVPGDVLRNAIVERALPNPSPVLYQILEMMLGAAQDISSVKDVLTGEASNNGQVGTTLALIEQGLQMFTAIYKRVYRGLKEEYQLLFQNIGKYADEENVRDYANLLDDPTADLAADFDGEDMDIRPVSDPQTVTNMQRMARAQFLGQFMGTPGINTQEIQRRMFEAADMDDIDKLFTPPAQPDPLMMALGQAEVENKQADTMEKQATAQSKVMDAETDRANAETKRLEALAKQFREGVSLAGAM